LALSEAEDLLAIHLKELGIEFTKEFRFYQERRWRIDYFLPSDSIGIEIEGAIWSHGRHSRGSGFQSDMEKYNTATMLGIRLLRFSTADVLTGKAKGFLKTWLKK
jgi:hypothetical protein